jgi:hypothetical protein
MEETTNVQQAQSAGQSTAWDALIAVLVCLPYDQVFGISTDLCVGLKYTSSAVVFATCLSSGRPAERPLVYQVSHT